MHARDIMTPNVITIGPQASVQDAARHLADYRISGMPVVDIDGHVLGMVTETDILRGSGVTVEKIMTRRVVRVQEDTPLDEIVGILASNHIKQALVMAGDEVLGVVSQADLVRVMASRWVCEVCGAVHLGQLPSACDACGVGSAHLARDLDPRREISLH